MPKALRPWERYAQEVVRGKVVVGRYHRLFVERHLRDLKEGRSRGLVFDRDAAQRAIDFFGFLHHSKGEWAGTPIRLEAWQQLVIAVLFGWKRADGTRRFRESYNEIARKNGKALAVDTPIPTPTGWSTMGELRVGDLVFDERGASCVVTAATTVQEGRPCYRVRFSDGTSIVADAAHEWFTYARVTGLPRTGRGRKSTWVQRHIRTTQQIRDTLRVESDRHSANHRVPLARPLVCAPRTLPVAPYTLGTWLGNGARDSAVICDGVEDLPFVADQIREEGYLVREQATPGRIGVAGLAADLRGLGVLAAKAIPPAYLRASVSDRRALLQGLMDADGTVSRAGQCEYSTTSPELHGGIVELLRSLGYKPTSKRVIARLNGVAVGWVWRTQFWSFADDPCVRLPRHVARLKPPPSRPVRSQFRQIIGVDPVESVPVRCIQVSSPSCLFLAGEGMVPTHNSTLAAGVGLYLFVADGEPGAEVYAAATKRDQAKIVHAEAERMVLASPGLRQRIGNVRNNLHIAGTASKFEPLGADENTMDGLNPHAVIIDEFHAHKTRGVYDVLRTATGARRQPMMFVITTAGYDRQSACYELHDYTAKVLEGAVDDDQFCGFICAIDETDDWRDERCWIKANPNLGVSVKAESLREQARKAAELPAEQNSFRRLRLNEWTEQDERWLDTALWERNAGEVDLSALRGRACFAGLDLSSTTDIAALVLLFPPLGEHDRWTVLPHFWIPEESMQERVKRDRVPYDAWVRDGLVHATEGNVVDYAFIRSQLHELVDEFDLRELAYDRWNATQLITQLMDDGVNCVPFGQGFQSMSAPTKELQKLLLAQSVSHGNHAVLRWMASNVSVKSDPAGNLKPDKSKSRQRIDGVVALIMALGRAMVQPEVSSIYDTRGLLTLGDGDE